MHHIGIPRHTQLITASKILIELVWRLWFKVALWDCCKLALLYCGITFILLTTQVFSDLTSRNSIHTEPCWSRNVRLSWCTRLTILTRCSWGSWLSSTSKYLINRSRRSYTWFTGVLSLVSRKEVIWRVFVELPSKWLVIFVVPYGVVSSYKW